MATDFFDPSGPVARQLDSAMRDALIQSLNSLMADTDGPLAGLGRVIGSAPARWRPDFLDFGAYFDLLMAGESAPAGDDATAVPTPSPDAADAVEWFSRRLGDSSAADAGEMGESAPCPRISTLTARYYNPSDISRITRWFDIEPGNAMALVGLSDEDFDVASGKVQRAMQAISLTAPELFDEITAITREVVLAQPNGTQRLIFGGASSFALWGAIAVNHQQHPSWWSYLPTIVHESAHSLLFAHARREPLVLNDPEARYSSPLRDDPRPMDGIFHAAFVSAREAYALRKYLEHPASGIDQAASRELAAQLTESVSAFWDCLGQIDRFGQLSPLGQEILEEVSGHMREAFPATR